MRAFFLLLAWLCAAQAFRVPFSTATAAVARRAARGVASVARAVSMRHRGSCACASCVSSRRQRAALCMAADGSAVFPDPTPGNPVLKHVDKERNVAFMRVALSGAQTQSAFAKSCDLFNDEVKNRDYKVAGFRKGAKLPPAYLYQMFGEDKVKLLCGNLLSEEIQDECEKIGLMFVGRGRITNFYEDQFVAGKPHVLEIECDLWPEIDYGAKGYKGLTVTVNTSPIDMEKYGQVKDSIRERYKELVPTPDGHAAVAGEVMIVNMKGFEKNPDGSAGAPLPAIAGGDGVEIILETGKFMEGMVEALIGGKAGETKNVPIRFPIRDRGPGAALSGKEAIFQVEVLAVKTKKVPEWNADLAARVRDGMTLEALEAEIVSAIEGDSKNNRENARNDALAQALLDTTSINILPESLVEETTQMRFQTMLVDFKEQGSTQEQLEEMATPEKYLKYKEISQPNVHKIVKLGMAFRDIAEKEKISVSPTEVREQLDVLSVQAKQRGEPVPDEAQAKDEIENALLRKKVFDMLAEHASITWVDAPVPANAT